MVLAWGARREAEAAHRDRQGQMQAEMDKLEHQAWVIYVKAQQDENQRRVAKATEEKLRRKKQRQLEKDLRDACFEGDLGRVGQLLDQEELPVSVSCKDANGEQPILEAAGGGHPDVCGLLLLQSADINCRGKYAVLPFVDIGLPLSR